MKKKIIFLFSSIFIFVFGVIFTTFLLLRFNAYYTITFVDYNNEVLDEFICRYKDTPKYNKEIPVRESNNEITYYFSSWSPNIEPATKDITYKAVYSDEPTKHKITFYNANNNVIKEEYYIYNTPTSEVTKPSSPSKSKYVFQYWTLDLNNPEEFNFTNENKITHSLSLYPYYIEASFISYSSKGYTWNDLLNLHYINVNENELVSVDLSSLGEGKLIIPEHITSIKENAFEGQDKINEIEIRSHIEVINKELFMDCTSLNKVTLPNEVTRIEDKAFYNCSSLERININSSTSYIGQYAFYNTKIKNITLEACEEINIGAFKDCSSLESCVVEGTIAYLSQGLFENCSSLQTFIIPQTITRIDPEAFKSCLSINGLIIPSSVIRIGYEAFSGCSSLEEIEIPNSNVQMEAFKDCSSLKKVTFLESNNGSNLQSIFKNCNALEEITIPFVGDRHSDKITLDRYPLGCMFSPTFVLGAKPLEQYDWINHMYTIKYYISPVLTKIHVIGNSALPICAFNNVELNELVLSKDIRSYGEDAFKDASINSIYFDGTLEEYNSITFSNEDSKPHLVANYFYTRNTSNEYELTVI